MCHEPRRGVLIGVNNPSPINNFYTLLILTIAYHHPLYFYSAANLKHCFMKLFICFVFVFSSFIVKGQEVDSAWLAKNILPNLSKDASTFLPDASFIDEKGNTRSLSEFKGKILLIDVWTTWCGNCIIRFPHSEQLYKRLKSIHLDTAIQFINICTEDSKSEWKKMLKKHSKKK